MDTHLTLKHPTIKTTIPALNPDNYLSASSPKRPHPNSAQNSKRLSCEIPVGFEKDTRPLSSTLRPSGSSVYPIKNSTFKEAQATRTIKPVNPRKILAEKVEIIQVRPKAQGIEASPWEMSSEIWQENIVHDNRSHKNSQHASPVIEQGTAINLPEIPENPRISVASLDNLVETEIQQLNTGRQTQNSLNSQQFTLLSRQSQVAFVVPQRLNHQASISDSENNNVTDSQDQNTINNLDQLFLIESGIHKSYTSKIRGLFCLFFTIFVGTWLIAEMINGTMSTRAIFIVAYVGLGYFALECIYRVPLKHGQRWQNAEELFKAFDVMSLITFFLILDISLSTGIHIVKAGVIPSLVFTICYYFSTNAPQNIKGPNTVARFLFTVQLLLIAVRIDQDIDWSWKIVLCFFWLAFGIVSFYLLLLGLIFIGMMVLFCYGRRIYENVDRATQFYGHIWNLLYVGLGVIFCGTFLTAAIVADDDYSFEPVIICVEVTRYLALSLLVYTIVFSKYVTPFLRAINSENEVTAADLAAVNTEKRLMSIEVEKQIINLVKLSSTYFLSLKDSFTIKDKAHIMQLKKSIRASKEEKFKNKYIRKETDKNKQLALRKPISIEEFKKDQEHLEEKLKNLTRQNSMAATLLRKKTVEDMSLYLAQHKDKEGENQTDFSTIIKNGKVICFSDGDLEKCDQFQNENDTEGNNTCYICVQNPCNAVMMNCGHGGVCYECALEFVKKKFECMQCRQKVERVVKINPDPRLGNIIKGYESIKLIFG